MKAIRAGRANLKEAYVVVKSGEIVLVGAHLAADDGLHARPPGSDAHAPAALHRDEIDRLAGKVERAGYTAPIDLHYRNGRLLGGRAREGQEAIRQARCDQGTRMESRAAAPRADARGIRTMTQPEAAALLSGIRRQRGLDRNAANFVPLSPVGFVERSATVYPSKVAVSDGAPSPMPSSTSAAAGLSALARRGVRHGDTVAIMAPNIPPMLEAHYAVPALGAVLNPLNVRLDGRTIASCLVHGEAKVLLTDAEFAPDPRRARTGESDAAGRRHR